MATKIREIKPIYLKELNYKQYYGTPEEEFPTLIPKVYRQMLVKFGFNRQYEIKEALQLTFQLSDRELAQYFTAALKYTPEEKEV